MALDVGRRRTGVAVSDATWSLARSLCVIEHRGRDRRLREIARLAHDYAVTRVVIGQPLNMDGSSGEQAAYVESYADRLADVLAEAEIETEMIHWDERLSTVEAESILRELGSSRKARRRLDAVAAAVILQDYLNALQSTLCKPASLDTDQEGSCEIP
jgi:putative holliday junction resolvase